ncbi:MAG: DMT family transporter [Alphaproteobacteria bacterium]|nr:DMT family transporter [Alphaproteobacteria bacterium]
MEWIWIPITLAGAFLQAFRTALQKFLKGRLSTNGATFTRFVYGAPLAVLYLFALRHHLGAEMPSPTPVFLAWVVTGGLSQILGTSMLLHVLGLRNFSIGVAYSKTETIQAAVFGLVFLGDPLSTWGLGAILLATFGVVVFSFRGGAMSGAAAAPAGGWRANAVLFGILSGSFFSISAVAYRGAALAVPVDNLFFAAAYAVAWASCLQTLMLGAYLRLREPGQITRVFRNWRIAALAGVTSMVGSVCWFTAMTIQTVAYVRTLGMVELIFTFLFSVFWFRERARAREIVGVLLLVAGIVMLLNPP